MVKEGKRNRKKKSASVQTSNLHRPVVICDLWQPSSSHLCLRLLVFLMILISFDDIFNW